MYTKNDVQQFENVVKALADNGALHQEVCEIAVKAVHATLEGGEELLSRAEAARLLKCSVKTIDRLCDEGKIVRIHTSKRAIRIRLSELKQMLGI
jgi:excisionase family DNA binding protein